MIAVLTLIGWTLAICGLMAAGIVRSRSSQNAEAVARACHELRGPLTAVRLGLDLAFRSGQLPGERIRALDLELRRAILALDDLSEVWQRRPVVGMSQPAEREQIDVRRLLADSVEALRGTAAAHGVSLRVATSGSPAVVSGRRLRLAQAIGNLIANAIEHGGGVVDISCRVERAVIRIEVVDGGAGLPAPVAALVRAGRVRHRGREPGLLRRRPQVTRRGHGLAVASAVAAAHGGRLAAAPSERGARLVLELPSAEAEPLPTLAGR